MTLAGFIVRNALRNKRRLILTVLSIAISLFLFTILQTALREMTQPAESESSALRLIVRHRVSLANVLPQMYQSRIERIPGVAVCTKVTWFGGVYQNENNFFPNFACEPDKVFRLFEEAAVDPQQQLAFEADRAGCVVGIKIMQRFGWKIGDRITLTGTIWPCDPQLTIRGVYHGGIDETQLFFHHDYLDELIGNNGMVGTYWIRAEDAASIPAVIARIDTQFRNTDAETKTETERAFQLSFVSMFGNIRTLVGSICGVIVFTMILVTASTMSMAIRERLREVAILKALGFDGRRVFGLILAESFALALLGGTLGCFGARLLFANLNIYEMSHGMFLKFEITPHILAGGMLIAALLGLISCILPARASIRTSIVEGLKELD